MTSKNTTVTPEMQNAYTHWDSPKLPEFPCNQANFLGFIRTAFMSGYQAARKPIPEIAGQTYGKDEILGLRDGVIQMRDAALEQGAMDWSVYLSHTIALLAHLANSTDKLETLQ